MSCSCQMEKDKIKQLIETYMESISKADVTMAEKLFLHSEKTSFISPRAHLKGWEEVQKLYTHAMPNLFSERKLTLATEPEINFFGSAALAVFYWDFDAVERESGERILNEGRESFLLEKQEDGEWRIVHVHYSRKPEPDNA